MVATGSYSFQDFDSRIPRILVVDDNEVNRILLERLFTGQGYHTDTASNGQEALVRLETTAYDLILLDIMMPIMDGLSALAHIRETESLRELPVVLISAMSDSEDIVKGLGLGANDYITKPIDMDIALARVKTQVTLKFLLDAHKDAIIQLEESQKMRERFFQMASHDIKGPLTNLKVAQTLISNMVDKDDERATGVLNTMLVSIDTMNQVVEDFLDSAAVQNGKLDVNVTTVKTDEIMYKVITGQKSYAYNKDIKLDVREISDLPILCDRTRLGQVLNNLLNNAIKYTPPNTTVTVSAKPTDDKMLISIADQGPGIPESERNKLFQPFGKLSTTPTGGESSHGLGLWIAKHLIDLQNGEIGVDCPPEGGSIFWIKMPLAEPVPT